MNILFLTQIVPYPPDAGPKVKTWHVLRYLVESGHQVILASFVRPDEKIHLPVLEELCAQVYTVPIRRSRPADLIYYLRSHLTGRPFLIERDDLPAMHSLIDQILSSHPIDCIHADQLTMTQYPLRIRQEQLDQSSDVSSGIIHKPILVFDAHNAVWTIVERMKENAPFYLKPVLALEAARVKQYEGAIIRNFDHTLAVTEIDKQALSDAVRSNAPHRIPALSNISVIPIAVDTDQLSPVPRHQGSMNIITLGTLHYPPNADGIRWFMQDVFPLILEKIPAATLTVIGKNPPKDFMERASQEPQSITVTGYVPDLVPYLEKAAVMVVPVRAGGGMRVRILETFSRGLPMVTTTIGLEGINAIPGDDILVADTPSDFADAVIRLLQDASLQTRLALNGRRLAESRYDWHNVLQEMDAIYDLPKQRLR